MVAAKVFSGCQQIHELPGAHYQHGLWLQLHVLSPDSETGSWVFLGTAAPQHLSACKAVVDNTQSALGRHGPALIKVYFTGKMVMIYSQSASNHLVNKSKQGDSHHDGYGTKAGCRNKDCSYSHLGKVPWRGWDFLIWNSIMSREKEHSEQREEHGRSSCDKCGLNGWHSAWINLPESCRIIRKRREGISRDGG